MNGLVNPLEGMRVLFLLLRGEAPRTFIGMCGGLRIPYLHNPLRLDNPLRLGDSPSGECNGLPLWERLPMWGVGHPLWGKTPPVLNKMISSGGEGLPRWAVR